MKKLTAIFFLGIFAIVASQRPQNSIQSCPLACACRNSICKTKGRRVVCRGVAVDCFGRKLTSLPEGIPLNVTGLRLSNNSIKHINFSHFEKFTKLANLIIDNNGAVDLTFGNPLKKLKRLSLKGNHLSYLPSNEMQKLKGLVDLNLQDNQIRDIRYIRFPQKLDMLNLNGNRVEFLTGGTFTKLKELRVLKLNNNKISRLNPRALKHLIKLESLELENNLLTRLGKDAFTGLPQAWYLNLKNNRISDIHSLAFRLFGYKNENHHQIHLENNALRFIERQMVEILIPRANRYALYFAGNPVFCDCNLVQLRDDSGNLLGDKTRILCDSPRNFTGSTLQDLHIAECCF